MKTSNQLNTRYSQLDGIGLLSALTWLGLGLAMDNLFKPNKPAGWPTLISQVVGNTPFGRPQEQVGWIQLVTMKQIQLTYFNRIDTIWLSA